MDRRALLVGGLALVAGSWGMARPGSADTGRYPWHRGAASAGQRLADRIAPPQGFEREVATPGSFADWLRGLPLKPAGTPVLLHSGKPKWRQDVHLAVIDIDTGKRDLQQCADAVMRLRAEWLLASKRKAEIAFNDTGRGKPMSFAKWARGERPTASGRDLVWSRKAAPDESYASFRRYMDTVFAWAGTHSLERELLLVSRGPVETGDVIIKGGFPGHAVLVADTAVDGSGARRHVLIQSFMPAQDMHVLKAPDGGAWFAIRADEPIMTPEWPFPAGSVRRWRSR